MDFETACDIVKRKLDLSYSFRAQQLETMRLVLDRKDTFCVLPTGYGKTDCFILPPLLLDQVNFLT